MSRKTLAALLVAVMTLNTVGPALADGPQQQWWCNPYDRKHRCIRLHGNSGGTTAEDWGGLAVVLGFACVMAGCLGGLDTGDQSGGGSRNKYPAPGGQGGPQGGNIFDGVPALPNYGVGR